MGSETVIFPNYTISPSAIADISNVISQYGDKVLVAGGKTALGKSRDKIERALNESPIKHFEFTWYGSECTFKNIDIMKDTVKDKGFNLIIGVGGGKALDTAKGAAERAAVPVITIPTLASTCAATTALSIIYTDKGGFEKLYYLKNPPVHIFIETTIIAESPWKYLWAGIGDTMAKYYEVNINLRNKTLDHSKSLAKQISLLCAEPMFEYGVKALADCKKDLESFELREVVLNNIISTGLVASLVGEENNGGAAHGVFFGLASQEEIEKNHLHGEVVAYGVLVMLIMDNNVKEFERLYSLYRKMGLPTCLNDLNLTDDETLLKTVIEKVLENPEMKKTPINVTRDLLRSAIKRLETFRG